MTLSGNGSGGGRPDAPATAIALDAPRFHELEPGRVSPHLIAIRFAVQDEDSENLSARVEVRDEEACLATWTLATPARGTNPVTGLSDGSEVEFVWDARADICGATADSVRLRIIPSGDDVDGLIAQVTVPRAGNTPVQVVDVGLEPKKDGLRVRFTLIDEESDRVPVDGDHFEVHVAPVGAPFSHGAIPLEVIELREFRSAPDGDTEFFSLDMDRLRRTELLTPFLDELSTPGFCSEIHVQIRARDFVTEEFGDDSTAGSDPFEFSNNTAPVVEITEVDARDPASGIVPVRFRILDADLNPADVSLEFDAGAGRGFRRANEFPLSPSSGDDLRTTAPPIAGERAPGPSADHTFFWDAGSQVDLLQRRLNLRMVARQCGDVASSFFSLTVRDIRFDEAVEFRFGGNVSDVASADFDGDGGLDLAVAVGNEGVTFLRGTHHGLEPSGRVIAVEGAERGLFLIPGDFNGDGRSDLIIDVSFSTSIPYLPGPIGDERDLVEVPIAETIELIGQVVGGDFNGDGIDDVAVALRESDTVVWLQGTPGGPVRPRRIPVGDSPASLAVEDFDDDGYVDLVVANRLSFDITYLRGGECGLVESGTLGLGGAPWRVGTGDFDGDGRLDLAVVLRSEDKVVYLRGTTPRDGPCTGESALDAPFRRAGEVSLRGPEGLATGDFDGDGRSDLVVAVPVRNEVSYIRGSSDGLERVADVPVGTRPLRGIPLDFDADGRIDVAVQNTESVTLLRGTPDGLRADAATSLALVDGPALLDTRDYDGDGRPDLVVATDRPSKLLYYRGLGGGLEEARRFRVGSAPRAIAARDFDGDGRLDVAVLSDGGDSPPSVTCFHGTPSGLESRGELPLGTLRSPGLLASGDFDGDGWIDVAVTGGIRDNTREGLVLVRGSPGGLRAAEPAETIDRATLFGDEPVAIASGDFNRDGVDDLAVANVDLGTVSYVQGSRTGETMATDLEVGRTPLALAVGDFDRDGTLDAVAASRDADTVTLLRGTEEGLKVAGAVPVGSGPVALAPGDFDGDGWVDLAVANLFSRDVTYLRGTPSGLERSADLPVGQQPALLAVGDFDADGRVDLVVATRLGRVEHLRGTPGGLHRVERATPLQVFGAPIAFETGDFDGDGFLDIVVASSEADRVTHFRGSARGLVRADTHPLLGVPTALVAADFDGDRQRDVVVAVDSRTSDRDEILFLRQRFLTAHASAFRDPGAETAATPRSALVDPGVPPRYRLELPDGAFTRGTQVCLVPAVPFELPHAEASERGTALVAVTATVAVLRETTRIEAAEPARLTLRLQGEHRAYAVRNPERLRVLRRIEDRETGEVEVVSPGVPAAEIRLVTTIADNRPGQDEGVRFPVREFGTYVVAAEIER